MKYPGTKLIVACLALASAILLAVASRGQDTTIADYPVIPAEDNADILYVLDVSQAGGAFTDGTNAHMTLGAVRGYLTKTGTGTVAVFSVGPTLTAPILGTPASVTLTNGTGLPVSTGISGLGAGIATALATPNSANIKTAVQDETGTAGALVFATAPQFTTSTETRAAAGGIKLLTTSDTDVQTGEKLGQIDFQAPLEADAGDSQLVAASIWAEAGAPFGAAINDTDLVFATAESETATEKARLTNSGEFHVTGGPAPGVAVNGPVVADNYNFAVGTGVADAYLVSLSPNPTPGIVNYAAGLQITFTVPATNTGPATVNVNGLGPLPLTKAAGGVVTTALAAGDIITGQVVTAVHDGNARFQVTSRLAQ